MQMLKRIVSASAAIFLLAAFTVCPANALDGGPGGPAVSAKSAILYEANTGTVLYEKDPDARMLIASTTKLMTALVVSENASPEETVIIPPECEYVEGSSMYLKHGERLTVRELMYGLMLSSGNDAAVALALHVSGSVEKFAQLMNAKARELGLENTHFVNPHGLNAEGHYSSARDLAVIMAAAMEDPFFAQTASTRSVVFGTRSLTNHNKLMWSYEGMLAGKTGYTKKAGRTLVTCAQRDGMRLICVTLNDPDDWDDHVKLLDMGFNGYRLVRVAAPGEVLGRVPVISGVRDSVGAVPVDGVSAVLPADSEPEIGVSLPDFLYARVEKGQPAGSVVLRLDGREICRAELLCTETVERDAGQRLSPAETARRFIGGLFN